LLARPGDPSAVRWRRWVAVAQIALRAVVGDVISVGGLSDIGGEQATKLDEAGAPRARSAA
jgi:hypothetical protein